ncbi:MAG: YigZ family protein [Chitinophagaceae bacterium]|nr:YigZ family protein [Chitinophagaceae bacterium]
MDHYFTIEKPSQAEFKDRGSKFIAYAFPVSDIAVFKKRLQELKKEHPKAVHNCFAYRIGTDGNTFRVSDDGEPAGTAGKPILGQLDSKSLINVAVIVVRYFGGTVLGVPGLINAYKTVSSLALQVTPIVQKQIEIMYSLEFDYTILNPVMTIIKQFNCSILEQENQLFCIMKIGVPKNRDAEVLYSLKEIKGVDIKAV